MQSSNLRQVAACCALVLAIGCAPSPAAPGTYADRGRVQTVAETAFGAWISRDCGFSRAAVDPSTGKQRSFWVFCDTTVNSQGINTRGSAAEQENFTAGTLPVLGDYPSPGAAFLPDAGAVCWDGSHPALWSQGLSPSSGGQFRVFYTSECKDNHTLSWGSVLWNPFTKQFSDNQRATFAYNPATNDLPAEKELATPIERGSYTYFSGGRSQNQQGVVIARVPTASIKNPAAYQWYTGVTNGVPTWGAWTAAQPVPNMPTGFTTMDYYPSLGAYVAIVQNQSGFFGGSNNNQIKIYQTTTPEIPGSWTLRHTVTNPGNCSAGKWCYAFIGHPELSTASLLMVSFYNDADRIAGQSFGHVSAGVIAW